MQLWVCVQRARVGGERALCWNRPGAGRRRRCTTRHVSSPSARPSPRLIRQEFSDGGITNGAAWYPIYGSMQDWSYIVHDCFELTLELAERKWPSERELPAIWEENREALLQLPLLATLGGCVAGVRCTGGKGGW